jgi:hypothetical protein
MRSVIRGHTGVPAFRRFSCAVTLTTPAERAIVGGAHLEAPWR